MIGKNTKNTIEDFWRNVDIRSENECWEWMAAKHRQGYGSYRWNGKRSVLSHRIALSTVKEVPDDMCVLHSCDNTACCNPRHLRLGTQQENMRDMKRRKRAYRADGERCHKAKLTDSEAFFIRYSDISRAELAKMFDVDWSTVNKIKEGKTWKHLP